MLSWQIGNVKVTRAVESMRPVAQEIGFIPQATPAALREIPWLYPDFVDDQDRLLLGIQAMLVETAGLRLVVDTCMGDGREGDAPDGPAMTPFLDALAAAGWSPESVDLVLCTHLHIDHVGWNTRLVDGKWVPTFPNARYLLGRIEHDHWMTDQSHGAPEIMARSVAPILAAGLADLVEVDHRISPEIRLIPTLGHTPGHVSVLIESAGQTAVITGDMVHHPCQIAQPDWGTSFDSDGPGACRSRHDRFAEWSADSRLVIGTHFAGPTAGRIEREPGGYRFRGGA